MILVESSGGYPAGRRHLERPLVTHVVPPATPTIKRHAFGWCHLQEGLWALPSWQCHHQECLQEHQTSSHHLSHLQDSPGYYTPTTCDQQILGRDATFPPPTSALKSIESVAASGNCSKRNISRKLVCAKVAKSDLPLDCRVAL